MSTPVKEYTKVLNNKKNKGTYITFVIDEKTYAVNVRCVNSAAGNPEIKPLLNCPNFVMGSYQSGNAAVPILNTRIILAKPKLFTKNKISILNVKVSFKGKGKSVGLIVDSLSGIKKIDSTKIEKLPIYEANDFVEGVTYCNSEMVLLLNLEKVINEPNVICFLNGFWDYEANTETTNKNGAKHG